MADKTFTLTLFAILLLLVLHQQLELTAASRPLDIHPPAIPKGSRSEPKPPPTDWYPINRYKMIETDAFRPTSPGHSPGVGHDNPPGA